MSERKVLTKYYPPDFDPSSFKRPRGPKSDGIKTQTVRLMAPWSMKCKSCGEYIYKGRKFNARKESSPDQRYYGIQIHTFYMKCTRCSAEIVFSTDPKNNDYAMVKGAMRNIGPAWQRAKDDETDEQRLDRLEREQAEAEAEEAWDGERDAMADLEAKNADAKRAMEAADALDELRHRNARINRADESGIDLAGLVPRAADEERERQEREDAEAARQAFAKAQTSVSDDGFVVEKDEGESSSATEKKVLIPAESESMSPATNGNSAISTTSTTSTTSATSATSTTSALGLWPSTIKKKKKDCAALLGIKKK